MWDYVTNDQYNLAPYPNVQNIGPNMEFLASIGVVGHYADMTANRGHDMAHLKLYLLGRKGLDPSLNDTSLVTEFTDGFFGTGAAVHVRSYLDIMGAAMLKSGAAAPPSTDPGKDPPAAGWEHSPVFGNVSFLAAATAMSEAQAEAAKLPELAERVAVAMMPLQFIALVRWKELVAFAQPAAWPFASTIEAEFAKFAATVQRVGVPYISQGARTKGRCGYHCNISQFRAQVLAG